MSIYVYEHTEANYATLADISFLFHATLMKFSVVACNQVHCVILFIFWEISKTIHFWKWCSVSMV